MRSIVAASTAAVLVGVCQTPTTDAFVLSSVPAKTSLKATQVDDDTTAMTAAAAAEEEVEVATIAPPLSKYSEAIPFLERPPALKGELAGDVGFDPLGFAKSREDLWVYREAEIKHARLAMLAAAGWPLSELFDRRIAAFFDMDPLVDEANRAPSLLNGNMEDVVPEWWGFCLGLCAAIDLYGNEKARSGDPDYIPGDLGFDPLGLYPENAEGQKRMQLAEIKHGRLAMIAVSGFAAQEAISQQGVVDETPFFFIPLTATLRSLLGGYGVAALSEEISYGDSEALNSIALN